jgi:hypothetical protein
MDKILETSLGRWSELMFSLEGIAVSDENLPEIINKKCSNYEIYSKGGVIVHMTKEEYEKYKK